jgi:2-polyprenyl-3-methyl-5-hydroxy-6-metoxy-1,4-benzoquinol methylase
VDINLQRIKIGRKLNPNFIFICADLEKLPFKNSSFDLILSYSVLHYVEWKILIKNISKILRCKGEVLLIENLSGHPLVSLYRFILKLSVKKYLPFMNPKEYIKTKDLKLFNEYFQCRFSFHHLLTPIALIKPILLKRKEQPLKLQSNAIFNRLWNIDKFLLKFQIFKRFSWFVSIHGIKT